jgi:hypothetical protein
VQTLSIYRYCISSLGYYMVMIPLEQEQQQEQKQDNSSSSRVLSPASAYNMLAVILSYEEQALYFHEKVISNNIKGIRLTTKGKPMNPFAPIANGSANPGIRNSDGHRGGPSFEQYGCITSASEIGKQFGCLNPVAVHTRISFLRDCGLVEVETYKPKYKKQNLRERPSWYTKLKVTEKGKRYLDVYKAMIDMLMVESKSEEEE